MTAMNKIPTRESLMILNDKLNESLADCCRCRKNERRKMERNPLSTRWSSILSSRQNLLVILLVWLNLSTIECLQKPQEGNKNTFQNKNSFKLYKLFSNSTIKLHFSSSMGRLMVSIRNPTSNKNRGFYHEQARNLYCK